MKNPVQNHPRKPVFFMQMGIKKKILLLFTGVISLVLVLSYTVIYRMFSSAMEKEIISYQESTISLNANLVNSFISSIRQISLQLVSDEAIGKYLSSAPAGTLDALQNRSNILNQFSHYLTPQIIDSSYSYKNTLFLNEQLPIAPYFEDKTLNDNPYASSSNIFNNSQVVSEEWYQNTTSSYNYTCTFINEKTNEFCFAQKIQNTYYTGPYLPDGVAVMVTSISIDALEKALALKPITPGSSCAIVRDDYYVLFNSNPEVPESLYSEILTILSGSRYGEGQSFILSLDGKQYFANYNTINYGMTLLFLTPYADVKSDISDAVRFYLFWAISIVLLVVVIIYLITSRITRPIISLSHFISSIEDTRNVEEDFFDTIHDRELVILCDSFKGLFAQVNQLIADIQQQSEQQMRSELRALQAQINPHFLFNTMDVINWIALSRDEDDIASIVDSVANMMRYSITNPEGLVPIQAELTNIREFLSVYQLRYNGKITLLLPPEEELQDIIIPKFILQPLIENSLRHGMEPDDQPITITFSISRTPAAIILEVSDDGKGCDPALLNEYLRYETNDLKVTNGFGIRNVNERIQLNYQDGESGLSYYINAAGMLTARITLCAAQRKES